MSSQGTRTMLAAYVPAPGRIDVDEFPVPQPQRGQVLVRMRRASVCGSDVHTVFDGLHRDDALGHPGYPGHEGIGEVVESHAAGFTPGIAVLTVPPGWGGSCFAEYQVLDERFLVPLPEAGDPDRLLMAQQLGTTIYAMRKFWAGEGGRSAAIIGVGSAGLFFLQQLRQLGFGTVLVADLEARRLAAARELGADVTVDARRASVVEAATDATAGEGADLVIEAAGYDECRAQAVEAVRNHGSLGFFGFPERPGMAPFPVQTAFRKGVRLDFVSATQFEPGLRSFHDALTAIRDGDIEVDHCLGTRFPLERAAEAVSAARERSAVKVIVDID